MKKILLPFFLLFTIVFQLPLSASAHSELETSTPAEGEKVTTDLEAVVLTFSTKIESLSTMTLKNGDKEIPLQISIEDDQMTGAITNPLENGTYTVAYKIIGADSHVIEGNYSFSVDRPTQEESPEQGTTDEGTQEKENNGEKALNDQEKNDKPNNPTYFAPLTIGLVIVIAVVSFFAFRRKR